MPLTLLSVVDMHVDTGVSVPSTFIKGTWHNWLEPIDPQAVAHLMGEIHHWV